MKMIIDKSAFVKSWGLTERSAGTGTMNIFSTVKIAAGDDGVEMQATDIKTSIICRAQGVTVVETGEAVIPIKGVSDLFKKAGSSEFTLQIDSGKALMLSGKSRYRFSTYPVEDFPKLPSSKDGVRFCEAQAANLAMAIDRGSICATGNDEYPQYLSSVYFEIKNGVLFVVSTDKRRLAVVRCEVEAPGSLEGEPKTEALLLPMKGLREFQRILGMLGDTDMVSISYDASQAYFSTDDMEFAVRRVESKFPNYENAIPESFGTEIDIDSSLLLSAVERVDIAVRDYNRVAVIKLESDECVISGRSPEFGEAVEKIPCELSGSDAIVGVNTRYFQDGVKALGEPVTRLCLNGTNGHVMVRGKASDEFICMIAPVDIEDDLRAREKSAEEPSADE